jgi:hypothetical protein
MMLLEENRQLKSRSNTTTISKDNRLAAPPNRAPPNPYANTQARSTSEPVQEEELKFTGIRRTKSCYMLR